MGILEQLEKVYLAIISMHVSMSSMWNIDIVSSGATRLGVRGVEGGEGAAPVSLRARAWAAAAWCFLNTHKGGSRGYMYCYFKVWLLRVWLDGEGNSGVIWFIA